MKKIILHFKILISLTVTMSVLICSLFQYKAYGNVSAGDGSPSSLPNGKPDAASYILSSESSLANTTHASSILSGTSTASASNILSGTNTPHVPDVPARMQLKAENEYLQLYLDEKSTDVAVFVKSTGDVWFTNPPDVDSDPIANAFNKGVMKSQFSVRYYNNNVQSSEMDNYNDGIQEGQFEIAYEDDGFTITYTLGEVANKLILPSVISEERFNSFVERMDESVQRQVRRNYTFYNLEGMREDERQSNIDLYPMLEFNSIYAIRSGTRDFMKEELMVYFVEAGYTLEDLIYDNEENGFAEENNKPWFVVPLTYRIDGENLLVSIDSKLIEYNQDSFYLVNIDMLKFFGAATDNEEGYVFIPDGSGALIYLDSQKTNVLPYSSPVYGVDRTVNALSYRKSNNDELYSVKMPVYGMRTGDKAWFAIIEKGDAYASINAENAGGTNSYNNVYAGFTHRTFGTVSMGDLIGARGFQMYSRPHYSESYLIRLAFLSGDDANYSGMANYYRNYLVQNGVLAKTDVKRDVPLYVEFIGAIEKLRSFMGIKYDSIEGLTSFKQAEGIIKELENANISNIKVQYSGWMNEGLDSSAPSTVKVARTVEKGLSLKKFIQNMESKGIPVYFSVDLQYVYEDNMFDGYTTISHSPRYYDKSVVRYGKALIPNGLIPETDINMISPYHVESFAEKFMKKSDKLNLAGVAVGHLTSDLYSDYMDKRYTDRETAVANNSSAIEALSNNYANGVLGYNANAYSFAYVKDILQVPLNSNYQRLVDESVPFYQMVIRGYVEYAGEPLNMSGDYATTYLKSIESGAGIYFKWIYADNSIVKNTDFDYLYSVNYKAWIDKCIESYAKANGALAGLQGQCIIWHERLLDKVYGTTYEDGTMVVVNYNDRAVEVDGRDVQAMDFILIN